MSVTGLPDELRDDRTEELPPVRLGAAGADAPRPAPEEPPDTDLADDEADEEDERPPIDPVRTALAATLAGAAAGWMLGGAFEGLLAELLGVAAAAFGGLYTAWTFRLSRPTGAQLMAMPLTLALAALATVTTGVGADQIPDLVAEALRAGGLALPPVPFDPGWRVIVVLIASFVTITAATAAVSLDRARVAVAIPGVVALVTILLQPPGEELVAVIVALVLAIGGLAVAYGVELQRSGAAATGTFEVRRLARAGATSLVLVGMLVALGQVGFLFPESDVDQVVPPKRPEAPPEPTDRVIFTAESAELLPWRVGVLDVYEDDAWKTPPFDPARLVDLSSSGGDVAEAVSADAAPGAVVESADTIEATFTLLDVEGRVVPLLAGTARIDGDFDRLEFYPRTQTVQVGGRQPRGTTYVVTAAAPPGADQLVAAPEPDPDDAALREFLQAPEPGPVAAQLIAEAGALDVPLYERLQYVRTTFYDKVVAAGEGEPVDVPPARVDQMLQEAEANPYEIVAGEALLARWVGVPARIGFGYYGGDVPAGGAGDVREIRPEHGAMWLEAYFEGHGWVPIMGRPPRAKSSLSDDQQEPDPFVQATDEIAARVFVPTAGRSISPLYLLVRHWTTRVLPVVVGVVVGVGGYPALLKVVRRRRRRRWAARRGPRARVGAAYAELRDVANDLNIGHPTLTPLEFLDAVEPDVEHRELAWLVTRVMWGDLQRDVREEDAVAAEEVARSVRRRLAGGQPYAMRVLGAVSRVSLKEPWDAAYPNLWWGWRRRRRHQLAVERGLVAPSGGRRRLRRLLPARLPLPRRWWRLRRYLRVPPLRVLVPTATAAAMLVMIALTGGVQQVDLTAPAAFTLPEVPDTLPGYVLERFDPAQQVFDHFDAEGRSLLAGGEYFAVREGGPDGLLVGTLEVAAFKPGVAARADELRDGLVRELLIDPEDLIRLGGERVYVKQVPEQTLFLWLAPDLSAMQLLTAGREFQQPEAVFAALLAVQRGEDVEELQPPTDTPPIDPRRGTP